MKALAIDTANSKILISAKNDDKSVTVIFNIGMKQSETLLPSIDYVLNQLQITPQELDYTVLCKGPGSFTGLRLGFAALKAIEAAYNVPIYGSLSLETYAFPFKNFDATVISVIDAKKEKFYAYAAENGKKIIDDGDYTLAEIAGKLEGCKKLFICGPDAAVFKPLIKNLLPSCTLICLGGEVPATDSLFIIAEDMIAGKIAPLADFDGPVYLRASEAEENLSK